MILSGSVVAQRVFFDAGEVDDVVEVQLPTIEFATTEVKGAGTSGTLNLPTTGQINPMTVTITQRSISKNAINLAMPGQHTLELRFIKDAKTSDGQMIPQGTKIFLTVYTVKFDPGKLAVGNTMDGSIEYSASRYRIVIEGEEVLLVDILNRIFKVNGTDYNAVINQKLGY